MTRHQHWEKIYQSKAASEVSWFQEAAAVSLTLIRRVGPDPVAPIIDVGGGASTLVDGLLDAGHQQITVLDIAGSALAVARQRLGERAAQVTWIESDVLTALLPAARYALWHDRAVFHFLTDAADRAQYVAKVRHAVQTGGHVIVASFAPDGPLRCSGLEVMRYSPETMLAQFGEGFELLDSIREDHSTPSGAAQAFVYCLFRLSSD